MLNQTFSGPVVDLDATTSLLVIPCNGDVTISEIGVVGTNTAGAGANLVLALEYVDCAGNAAVEILTATGTAALGVGDTLKRRCDVKVDKAAGTVTSAGTVTTDADGIGYLRVRVKTAGAATSDGVLYAIGHYQGSGNSAATGEIVVTS